MNPLKYFEEFEEYTIAWGITYNIIKWKKTKLSINSLSQFYLKLNHKICTYLHTMHTHKKEKKPDVSPSVN